MRTSDISSRLGHPSIGYEFVDFPYEPAAEAQDGRPQLYRRAGKRLLDVTGAAVLLVLLSPLMMVVCLAVALSGGRPLFGHKRVGQNGRSFRCLKFRSMVIDAEARLNEVLANDPEAAEEWERDRKLKNDPRVTPVGKFLRMTSLDELPQLWNVLRGDMSLVGPRPVIAGELRLYGQDARQYLKVRPGVTGPWQVQGRNDISYDARVALDSAYVRDLTLVGDIRILFLTAFAVIAASGH
jgi:undecaprenyl-phosphate galactose phosphotransferase